MTAGPHHAAARGAAEAIARRAQRHVDTSMRPVMLGTVRALADPMQVELHDSAIILEEGAHLTLSQFVRWWDTNYQLLVGDVLVLTVLEDDSYVAFDVMSDRDIDAGVRPSRPPAGATGDMRDAEGSDEAGLFDVTATASAVPSGGGTPSVSVQVDWNHHLAKKLEVYDSAGTRIGWVPVFSTLP